MTLCNKSFSATQFALLSALSAVGRVYVGPVAGWFVEAHGWSTFYLFSVAAAVPGLILLLVCRQTLEYTRVNDNFISRTEYPAGYAFAMWTLAAGVSLLAVWLLLLTMDALDLTHFSFLPALLEVGVLVAPFWRRAWWFTGLSGATKNASDVICKYYLAVVITRRNYYGQINISIAY